MDPVTMMAIGGAISLGSGLIGYLTERGERKKADAIIRRAIEQYGEASEEAISNVALEVLGPTELKEIQLDPAYKDAQMAALSELENLGQSGGLRLSDEAVLGKLNNDLARQENAARGRIQHEMDTRGIGGGGTELAMLRASGQDRLQRQSEASMDVAANAQDRAYQAIIDGGRLAGSIRGQEYAEKSDAARAQDAINRYNTQVRNDLYQWQAGQRLGVQRDLFDANRERAGQKRQDARDTRQTIGGVGAGAGQIATNVAVYGQQPQASSTVKPAVQPNKYQAQDYNPYDDEDLWNMGGK